MNSGMVHSYDVRNKLQWVIKKATKYHLYISCMNAIIITRPILICLSSGPFFCQDQAEH